MSNTVGTVLLTREQIEERAREIGEEIARDYEGEEVYLIGTLRGAVVWMADMMKNIKNDMEIDFVMASSYGSSTTSSGVVKIKKDLEGDIYGKNVIIVEDIVDTGTTLKFLKEHLADRNPNSFGQAGKTCSRCQRRLCGLFHRQSFRRGIRIGLRSEIQKSAVHKLSGGLKSGRPKEVLPKAHGGVFYSLASL